MASIRNGHHSEWLPFGMAPIRISFFSEWLPFGMAPIWNGAHSEELPFGKVPIRNHYIFSRCRAEHGRPEFPLRLMFLAVWGSHAGVSSASHRCYQNIRNIQNIQITCLKICLNMFIFWNLSSSFFLISPSTPIPGVSQSFLPGEKYRKNMF